MASVILTNIVNSGIYRYIDDVRQNSIINKNDEGLELTPVAIYCRFSDSKQEGGYSIKAQRDACAKYAVDNGYRIVQEYVDEAISGRTDDRPEFQRMMSDSATKLFKFLIIHKYDRFSRNRYDHIIYKRELEKSGVKVISVSEPVDHDNAYGVIMESLYEGLADAYSKNLARETMKGMTEGAKAGFWQSGKPPFGYSIKKVPYNGKEKSKLEVQPEEAAVVRHIFDSYVNGQVGMKRLAQDINVMGYRTRSGSQFLSTSIEKILNNTVYTGVIIFNREEKHGYPTIYTENAHEAIISQELFNEAQCIKSLRHTEKVRPAFDYKLTSYLECGECGSSMSGESAHNRHKSIFHYYRCRDNRTTGKCSSKRVRRELIEDHVFKGIQSVIASKKTIHAVVRDLLDIAKSKIKKNVSDLKRIDSEIPILKRKYDKLMRIIEEQDDIDYADIAPRIKEIKRELELLKAQRVKLSRDNEKLSYNNINKSKFKDQITNELIQMFSGANIMEHVQLQRLIKKIVLLGDEVKVFWQIPLEGSYSAVNGSPLGALYEHFNQSRVLQFSFKLKAA